ncbi:unnamed protein product [Hymenolepis diminuta]|uniref:Uncharacterized protein n=1 Tax=Hymenolepis diminuta TaxID=6216 RepID=A0A564Z7Q2_HYMDI|nr:unnamed protein product [Hymenolepis diminuta]
MYTISILLLSSPLKILCNLPLFQPSFYFKILLILPFYLLLYLDPNFLGFFEVGELPCLLECPNTYNN